MVGIIVISPPELKLLLPGGAGQHIFSPGSAFSFPDRPFFSPGWPNLPGSWPEMVNY
jgi:hypothetical protein